MYCDIHTWCTGCYECPCANSTDPNGDRDCPHHGEEIRSLEQGETALSPEDQREADMALLWPIWAEELGVSA